MLRALPPRDQADVRGRLLVEPAEPEVGDRAGGGLDRGAALLGDHARVRRAAVEADGSSSARTARRGSRRRSAPPGRRRSRARASSRVWSKAPAPSRPTSSIGVKTSSTPACGRESSTSRRAASIIATTADLLSAPRIVPPAFRTTPSSTTGSSGPCGGTVSRWAQRKSGVPPFVRPGTRQSRLPAFEPIRRPASSSSTSSPRPRSSAVTRSAIARSSPGGLGIAASSRKRSSAILGVSDKNRYLHRRMTVADPLIQATLLAEALENGPVAIFVLGDDLRYVAVNRLAVRAARVRAGGAARPHGPGHRSRRERGRGPAPGDPRRPPPRPLDAPTQGRRVRRGGVPGEGDVGRRRALLRQRLLAVDD